VQHSAQRRVSRLPAPDPITTRPAFAHASEAELARILDFYDVRWDYEPVTFPIAWSMQGDVVESFAPDFYLPDLDLFVELTTLKQTLVRKKNRKLRRLRELYPDVRIKLFYARDFRALLLKFGRLALVDELTGTPGQATPPRPADLIVAEAGVNAAVAAVAASAEVEADVIHGAAWNGETTEPGLDDGHPAARRPRRRGRRRRRDGVATGAESLVTAGGQSGTEGVP
jgi:hypothetical protein